MQHRFPSLLAVSMTLLLGLGLGGCFGCEDCNGMVPSEDIGNAGTARYAALHAWASDGSISLPGDTLLDPGAFLKARWDSVGDQSRIASDLKAIVADWNARRPILSGFTVVDSVSDGIATTQLVRFSVEGIEQGALIRRPLGVAGPLPVILFGHPSDDGMSSFYLNFFTNLLGDVANRALIVAPAFRGETASLDIDTLVAQVESPVISQSPWDRDVDDALALLTEALSRYPTDPTRIAAVGYSRGAGVSLLAGLRDARIGSVLEIAGPADLFAPSFQKVAIRLLNGGTSELPGIKVIDTLLIKPFAAGTISVDSMRRGMLRRSPARWARSGLLPTTVAFHGDADTVVNIDQSRALVAAAPAQATLRTATGANHVSVLFARGLSDSLSGRLRSAWGM